MLLHFEKASIVKPIFEGRKRLGKGGSAEAYAEFRRIAGKT
jgi:hypothetical protein